MVKTNSFSSASILIKIKDGYLLWTNIVSHIPKCARYTIGTRIENKFLDLLELSYSTYFTEKDKKVEKIIECVSILDTLKFFIYISWEAKFISPKSYESMTVLLDTVGKMFGGWKKSLEILEKKRHTA